MRVVHKYGGSSVATIEQIKAIASYAKELTENGNELVIVASAMGKTTNGLISLAKQLTDSPSRREMDALMSTGEIQTVSLIAIALQSIGVPAVSFTGFQSGFITNEVHSRAFIKKLETKKVEDALKEGKVVVVAGFQGISENGNITTLGRGGSDTTAVALAAKLKCPCEIYTDVEAVYTIDPRVYPEAKKIKCVSYEEMMEMAASGAKVLETRCVELAKKFNVKLYLGKALERDKNKGTYIMNKEDVMFEEMPVSSLTIKEDVAIVTVRAKKEKAKNISRVFTIISNNTINLDMISQNIFGEEVVFSFSCLNEQGNEIAGIIKNDSELQDVNVEIQENQNKIVLVGLGMATHTGVASRVFNTLSENNIGYGQITTSEISISFTVDSDCKSKAVRVLAKEFEL